MANTTTVDLAADVWSDDLAAGAAQMTLQPRVAGSHQVRVFIGAAKPTASASIGIRLPDGGLRLAAPDFVTGDKVYCLSETGNSVITVVK